MNRVSAAVGVALFALPLVAGLVLASMDFLKMEAWQGVWSQPQTFRAWGLSLWTALASSALALLATLVIATQLYPGRAWDRMTTLLSALLSAPHAAFAIGLVFLFAPSGWLFRLASPWLTGRDYPPDWGTVQDPWGLSLILGLVLKEVPFLLWVLLSIMERGAIRVHLLTASTMGYGRTAAWLKVVWPQVLPRLALPLLAVFCYGLTVVDMAIILGPSNPPTLGVLAWQALLEPDIVRNAEAVVASLLLVGTVTLIVVLGWLGWRAMGILLHAGWSRGARGRSSEATWPARTLLVLGGGLYGLVLFLLFLWSVAGLWIFPAWLPAGASLTAWRIVWGSLETVWNTFFLATATGLAALCLAVAWLEWSPWARHRLSGIVLFAPLMLPSLLVVVGLHQLLLRVHLDETFAGLMLAHGVMVLPYVVLTLAPSYLGFDDRFVVTASTMGKAELVTLVRIKWPLLIKPIAAAFAVGFAVSVAQYLPTQFIGAGRFPTVTTEAVALSSGGHRQLTAAYALLQMVLPLLVFVAAHSVGRASDRSRTV